jgi:subtilisin family serine protease
METAPHLSFEQDEYKTDRFIIKYKSENVKGSIVGTLSQDLKRVRSFKNSDFNNFNVVTTKTKMNKEEFIAKIKSKNADSDIEYIQPDYELTAASLETEKDTQQDEQDITETEQQAADQPDDNSDNQEAQIGTQFENESLPEFLQGFPLDDPIVESWLKEQSVKKPAPEDMWGQDNNESDTGTLVNEADVNLQAAWERSQGEGTVVAILDTGIDITHQSIAQNIWTNNAEIPDNGIDDDGNGYIDDAYGWNFCDDNNEVHRQDLAYDEWHGSHIAGIIAGVAPKAKIMPLKVFKNGMAYTSDIIEAIAYAEKNGAFVFLCSGGS